MESFNESTGGNAPVASPPLVASLFQVHIDQVLTLLWNKVFTVDQNFD